jgi:8-oxo-dGTP pyrophosphatase MutT (NUDIX family)
VAYADAARVGAPPVEHVLAWSVEHRAAGLLIDTAVKDGRGLFDWLDVVTLRGLVAAAGEADLLIALAGSLKGRSLEQAVALGPDIVAVRGAACKRGDRRGRVDVDQVKALCNIVQGPRPIVRPIHKDGRVHGVVAGCRREDGRWLHIRRSKHVHAAPGKVCLPGGAIELGESQRDAVIRECREEIGVEIEPLQCVWHHAYQDKNLTLFAWLATLKPGQIKPDPAEVEQVMWLATHEAATHVDALPFHDQIVAALQAAADQMAAQMCDEM